MNTRVNIKQVDDHIEVDEIVLTIEQAEHLKELLEAGMND